MALPTNNLVILKDRVLYTDPDSLSKPLSELTVLSLSGPVTCGNINEIPKNQIEQVQFIAPLFHQMELTNDEHLKTILRRAIDHAIAEEGRSKVLRTHKPQVGQQFVKRSNPNAGAIYTVCSTDEVPDVPTVTLKAEELPKLVVSQDSDFFKSWEKVEPVPIETAVHSKVVVA